MEKKNFESHSKTGESPASLVDRAKAQLAADAEAAAPQIMAMQLVRLVTEQVETLLRGAGIADEKKLHEIVNSPFGEVVINALCGVGLQLIPVPEGGDAEKYRDSVAAALRVKSLVVGGDAVVEFFSAPFRQVLAAKIQGGMSMASLLPRPSTPFKVSDPAREEATKPAQ